MWKFALYSSVKTSRTTPQNSSNHDHDYHSHPTTIATENRRIDQQRRAARRLQLEEGESHHVSSHQARNEPHTTAIENRAYTNAFTDDSEELTERSNCCRSLRRLIRRRPKAQRSDSFLARFSMNRARMQDKTLSREDTEAVTHIDLSESKEERRCTDRIGRNLKSALAPTSVYFYVWLVIISLCILYNITLIIARVVFSQLQQDYFVYWIVLDYFCDAMYLLDMFIRFRTGYLEEGIMVQSSKKLAKNYLKSTEFIFDLISILPTDLIYCAIGFNPAVRFNRLLRLQRLREFFDRTIRRTIYPNLFRILNLLLYILIIVHWNACFYYAISGLIGYGTDGWVYPNATNVTMSALSRKYVYSFYWSTLTLLTIGETPHPEKDVEYLFVVIDFLVGVLIFATIVGNVGSMITNMNHDRSIFTQKLDAVKRYMKIRRVNPALEKKVISWFDYLWSNRHSMDEEEVLDALPEKLRAEIAIHVHLETLRQVNIFKDCEPGLLVELVLKLKLQVFSPGDYVCRKGDIGREMYIVKKGILKVFGDDGQVFATLTSGNVFGEISIMEIPGSKTGNRRIANVMSIGFADCFVLSKSDLWGILKDYPTTRQKLIDRGKDILALDNMLADEDMESLDSNGTITTASSAVESRVRGLEDKLDKMNKQIDKLNNHHRTQQSKLMDRIDELEDALLSLRTINNLQLRYEPSDRGHQGHHTDATIHKDDTDIQVEDVTPDPLNVISRQLNGSVKLLTAAETQNETLANGDIPLPHSLNSST